MTIAKIKPRWCIERMQYIYKRYSLIIKHGHPNRGIVVRRRIDLIGLVGEPNLWASFDQYRLGWMTQPQISYISSLVWDFYTYYAFTLYLVSLRNSRIVEQPHLEHTLV